MANWRYNNKLGFIFLNPIKNEVMKFWLMTLQIYTCHFNGVVWLQGKRLPINMWFPLYFTIILLKKSSTFGVFFEKLNI